MLELLWNFLYGLYALGEGIITGLKKNPILIKFFIGIALFGFIKGKLLRR